MNRALVIGQMTAKQTLGLRRFLLFGLGSLVPAGIFYLASRQIVGGELVEVFMGFNYAFFFNIVVPIVALIMAGSALGDERRDGTLSFIVLRPISRYAIAGAKLGGALATAFAVTVAGSVALGVVMGVRSGEWTYLVPGLVGTFIAAAIYVALFLPLGYVTERATLIGLGFVFIWESAIAGSIPGLAGTSPWRIGFVALLDLAPERAIPEVPDFAIGDLAISVSDSLTKTVGLIIVSTLVTGLILRKRDLV